MKYGRCGNRDIRKRAQKHESGKNSEKEIGRKAGKSE